MLKARNDVLTPRMVETLIDVLKGRSLSMEQWSSLNGLLRRDLVYLMPPCADGTRHHALTEKGFKRMRRYHVHSRECYDDSGPGSGGVNLICGKTEGEEVSLG